MLTSIQAIYNDFPQRFWTVAAVSFIDKVGGTMLFPFFALYITQQFNVGMTQAGIVLGIFAISSMLGGMIGGALTDRWGRRRLIIAGLIFSAVSTLALGLVRELALLYPLAFVIGLLSDLAGPAHQAMVADILPEEKRQEGFGVLRVVGNLAWIVGPSITGFIVGHSFLALFIIDAIISCIVAALFFFFIPETKPAAQAGETPESLLATFRGYGRALGDMAFMAYILGLSLLGVVYIQMYNSLSVFLRDQHGVSPQGYGFLLTASAITVIFLQFWTSRRIKSLPPFLLMVAGSLFYLLGFGMYGFVASYALFVTAIVVVTLGEMIVMPTSAALAAGFAPEAMRGRYMAIFGLTFALPAAVGPAAAGIILDNYDPNWLWYFGALLCGLAALSFYLLHLRLGRRSQFQAAPEAAN